MKVQVYAYDLTRGMASALSPMLLGYQIEAVWHTGVVIDGDREIFFGCGIANARAGATMFGQPVRVLDMGETEVTPDILEELLSDLAPRYRPQDYNLLFHNCNTFSNELVQLLTGESLPDYITGQAQHLFNTPWGESLIPMIMAMEGFTGGATAGGQQQQQQQQQATAPPPAAATAGGRAPAAAAAAAAAAAGSSAIVQATSTQAAAAAAQQDHQAATATDAGSGASDSVQPSTSQGSAAASAAANAGMAAVARAAQAQSPQQQATTDGSSGSSGAAQQDAPPADAAAAAVGKATEGVAGLSLTADSRAASAQEQQ